MSSDIKSILVVDDEPKITEVVRSYLENSGYKVFEAFSGSQAMDLFKKINPSLIVLDLMLPDMTGQEICCIIRKESGVPIIMLTARIDEKDILNGLGIGADDYVTKPFSPRQLVARVEAVLRRTGVHEGKPDILSFNNDDISIDNRNYTVKKRGNIVSLTPNEFKILSTLARYPRKVFTREELIRIALGDDFDGFDRVIDTHIKNIRQKIETDVKVPQYVVTVHGVGYRFGGE